MQRTPAQAGEIVAARRRELGADVAELAREAQVDVKTLRSLEAGERMPRDSTKAKLERALQWAPGSINAVLAGEDPKPYLDPTVLDPSVGTGAFLQTALDSTDEIMSTVLRYDAARAEVNRLEWEYSRLREIDDINDATEELDEVVEMLHERRGGRPWTPPWDPAVAETYGPEAEPWSSSWWWFRESLLNGTRDASTVSRVHQYSLDRPGIPVNPFARPARQDDVQRDSLYMNVYDEWAELQERLQQADVALSPNLTVDAASAFANQVQQWGVTEGRAEYLSWLVSHLERTGNDAAVIVAEIERRMLNYPNRQAEDDVSNQDRFTAILRKFTNDLHTAASNAADFELAARDLGDEPVGRKIRRAQDEAGELPDADGPEGGA